MGRVHSTHRGSVMSPALLMTLAINSRTISPTSANYHLPNWPPSPDFPIVINESGTIISRFEDSRWDISCWTNKSLVVNFGDGAQRKNVPSISTENSDLLRMIAAWLLWGPRGTMMASTFARQIMMLRPLFIHCSRINISADTLDRFPEAIDTLAPLIQPVSVAEFLRILHLLYEHRDQLGFYILSPASLRRLAASLPQHRRRQTAYIPPRIWLYQVLRLREFLDDFHAHREKIEACYEHCMNAYLSDSETREKRKYPSNEGSLFKTKGFYASAFSGNFSYGSFEKTAENFEIDDLLKKWCTLGKHGLIISTLSRYLRMVLEVGCAYILNFSLMRIDECWSLRCDCYVTEEDKDFGTMHLLRGSTKKTIKDDDALWITAPSTSLAVDAMSTVSKMRLRTISKYTDIGFNSESSRNPYLALPAVEPWSTKARGIDDFSKRQNYPNYSAVIQECPKLFDMDQLRITDDDLNIARLVTPDLNGYQYKVGEIWPLAWHQLRRTGAVNMQASGLVSDPSIQYQLKHVTRAMALYYGQGFSHIKLNEAAKTEYIRTMYEVQGIEISLLFTNRVVSPYGPSHKDEILQLVSTKDSAALTKASKEGVVSWRETLLGGCTKRGPCTYGGIDNIIRCGGGDGRSPCVHALFDREKIVKMEKLKSLLSLRIESAKRNSPYADSLAAQKLAVENALDATKP